MWVALFVALLATGETVAVVAEPMKTEAECKAKNADAEAMVKAGMVEGVRKYALTCVRVELK